MAGSSPSSRTRRTWSEVTATASGTCSSDNRVTGQTFRVSAAQANGASGAPALSEDGRYLAFQSAADNIAGEDTNGVSDVFLADLTTAAVTRVSVGAAGLQGNHASYRTSISADGRLVGFVSEASNLVAADTNDLADLFVRDLTEPPPGPGPGPGPRPGPGPGVRGPWISLVGKRLPVRAGRFGITVRCRDRAGCRGRIRVRGVGLLRRGRSRRRVVLTASATFSVRANTSRRVTLRLSPRNAGLLRRLHRLRAVVTATGKDGASLSRKVTARVVLQA